MVAISHIVSSASPVTSDFHRDSFRRSLSSSWRSRVRWAHSAVRPIQYGRMVDEKWAILDPFNFFKNFSNFLSVYSTGMVKLNASADARKSYPFWLTVGITSSATSATKLSCFRATPSQELRAVLANRARYRVSLSIPRRLIP